MADMSDISNQTAGTTPPRREPIRKTTSRMLTPRKVVYVIGRRILSAEEFNRRLLRTLIIFAMLIILVGGGIRFGGRLVAVILPNIGSLGNILEALATAQPTAVTASEPPTVGPPANPSDEPVLSAIAGTSRVKTQDVNLRQLPGPDEQKIAVLHRGVAVEVLGEAKRVGDGVWIRIRAQDAEGWVNQRYIIPVEAYVPDSHTRARVTGVAPDTLRVRAEPNQSADILGRLSEGSEVAMLEWQSQEGTEWWLVEVDDLKGWASASYLQQLP